MPQESWTQVVDATSADAVELRLGHDQQSVILVGRQKLKIKQGRSLDGGFEVIVDENQIHEVRYDQVTKQFRIKIWNIQI